jgi:GT2 family glycosyltransferase
LSKSFSILIISYNTGDYLGHSLSNLFPGEASDDINAQVVVYDCGSSDTTPLVLARYSDKITLLGDGGNRGFSHAVNQGLEACDGDWILLANGDVVIGPEKLASMQDIATRLDAPAVIGFSQINEKGFPQLTWGEQPRVASESQRKKQTALYNRGEGHWPQSSGLLEVGWISGSLIFGSKESWQQAGEWNESYFIFFEDADWCMQARKNGVDIYFSSEVQLLHGHGQSAVSRPLLAQAAYRHAQGLYWSRHGAYWERCLISTMLAYRWLSWLLMGGKEGRKKIQYLRQLKKRPPGGAMQ